VSAALEQTVRQTAQDSFTVRAGLQLHSGKPTLMLGPRYRVLFPLDAWTLRLVEELLWRSIVGWESRTTADLERQVAEGLFFRASNQWTWTEDVDGFIYAFTFHLGQPLSPRRGVEYEWVNLFHTEPVHELTEVVLRVRYRQQFWREWLFFELAPQYRFPRDRSFDAVPGILFRLDIMLGGYRGL
jgi:hypothetical protein